jgi:hypothetical protein
VTDYANEVKPGDPTPPAKMIGLMGASTAIFGEVLRAALPELERVPPRAAGTVYRFERG